MLSLHGIGVRVRFIRSMILLFDCIDLVFDLVLWWHSSIMSSYWHQQYSIPGNAYWFMGDHVSHLVPGSWYRTAWLNDAFYFTWKAYIFWGKLAVSSGIIILPGYILLFLSKQHWRRCQQTFLPNAWSLSLGITYQDQFQAAMSFSDASFTERGRLGNGWSTRRKLLPMIACRMLPHGAWRERLVFGWFYFFIDFVRVLSGSSTMMGWAPNLFEW